MSTNGVPTVLGRFRQHPGFRRLQELLRPVSKRPIWWVIEQPTPRQLDYAEACKACRFVRESRGQRRVCQRQFLKVLEQARVAKQPRTFTCPIQRAAFVMALPRWKPMENSAKSWKTQ